MGTRVAKLPEFGMLPLDNQARYLRHWIYKRYPDSSWTAARPSGADNELGYPTVNCQNAPVSCYPRAPLLLSTDRTYTYTKKAMREVIIRILYLGPYRRQGLQTGWRRCLLSEARAGAHVGVCGSSDLLQVLL